MSSRFLKHLLPALILLTLTAAGACNETDGTIPPSGSAEFEIISLDVTPSEVIVGEIVIITAEVKNTGGTIGTYSVVLTVDSVTVETKEVEIAAGVTETATFSLAKDKAGTYEIGVGGLSSSLAVTEPTPGVILDLEEDVDYGFLDIVSVKVTVEGEEVVAQIELSELPETLIFSEAPKNRIEYKWSIYIDTDADSTTGGSSEIQALGADYEMTLFHNSSGEAEEDSILSACQTSLWKIEGNDWIRQHLAVVTAETDYVRNTLTIRGAVPGLNSNSRWFAVAYYWDTVSERDWQDRAPDTDFALLLEN